MDWVHHAIPSTDVLSFTASGQPWIYPIVSGLLFYIIFLAGGYTLLSVLGAVACMGTTALLLRRGIGDGALAIVALPRIAARTGPRAEMFTAILFAAFLSLLWEYFTTGRARLWLLPVLMVAWVNLHLGFVAGFALIAGYIACELLEMFFRANVARMLWNGWHAWPWSRSRFQPRSSIPGDGISMAPFCGKTRQWRNTPSGSTSGRAFPSIGTAGALVSVRDTKGVFLLFAVACGVRRSRCQKADRRCIVDRRSYVGIQHVRLQGIVGVVVIVGGWIVFRTHGTGGAKSLDLRMKQIVLGGGRAVFDSCRHAFSTW